MAGRSVTLEAWGKGTDDYPRRHIRSHVTLDDINEAILYNPRNCYQNYNAATNSSERMLHTYMGTLLPKLRNVSYSTAGELSPLLNDPTCRTIGMGTRIFLCGARGYVSWQGTQFNTSNPSMSTAFRSAARAPWPQSATCARCRPTTCAPPTTRNTA